jgi:predicted Rossmann fold nucleotide-binding protein DprA/Smf involved in DNA uptake
MIVAFTGPSELTRQQEFPVVERLEQQDYQERNATLDTWRSGCAHGVDTIAARQAIMGDVLIVELYVPAAPHNADLVEELAPRATIIRCPSGNEPYRIRNNLMVEGADLLIAFVRSEHFYRSGEWMTINIARKLGVPVDVTVI